MSTPARSSRLVAIVGRVNWLMAAVFLASAVVQYNDPDPARWIALYVAAGLACLVWRRWSWSRLAAGAVAAVAVVWAATLAPDVLGAVGLGDLFASMDEPGGEVELGRELGGLAIVVAWMAVLVVSKR